MVERTEIIKGETRAKQHIEDVRKKGGHDFRERKIDNDTFKITYEIAEYEER